MAILTYFIMLQLQYVFVCDVLEKFYFPFKIKYIVPALLKQNS